MTSTTSVSARAATCRTAASCTYRGRFPAVRPAGRSIVGEEVTIGHQVVMHGCTIGNRCLIGIGSIVLDGVVVEDEVMIGAGSVVTPGKRLDSRRSVPRQPGAPRARADRRRDRALSGGRAPLRRPQARLRAKRARRTSAQRLEHRCRVAGRTLRQRPNASAACSTSMPQPCTSARRRGHSAPVRERGLAVP